MLAQLQNSKIFLKDVYESDKLSLGSDNKDFVVCGFLFFQDFYKITWWKIQSIGSQRDKTEHACTHKHPLKEISLKNGKSIGRKGHKKDKAPDVFGNMSGSVCYNLECIRERIGGKIGEIGVTLQKPGMSGWENLLATGSHGRFLNGIFIIIKITFSLKKKKQYTLFLFFKLIYFLIER